MGNQFNKNNWLPDTEIKWRATKKHFFNDQLEKALNKYHDPLVVGNKLSELLKSCEIEAVNLVTPRAVEKWASPETVDKWKNIIKDRQMLFELREIGKSIANTLRPLAGNTFTQWVCHVLNLTFKNKKLPLECVTSGSIKKELTKSLVLKIDATRFEMRDYKPDIDIIILKISDKGKKPIAIISAKTTLAERVMQTINWHRYLEQLPNSLQNIKLYLVTAWDTFESGTNRYRVQELDGVYVCNEAVKEYGKIKLFSRIIDDLVELAKP
ncbi:TPA: hypothetical protein ENX78_19810 [Candidatus Poribacteria bacterium]|nr:hypothetical protein [Candidatus Poribacteria bacterium]